MAAPGAAWIGNRDSEHPLMLAAGRVAGQPQTSVSVQYSAGRAEFHAWHSAGPGPL